MKLDTRNYLHKTIIWLMHLSINYGIKMLTIFFLTSAAGEPHAHGT